MTEANIRGDARELPARVRLRPYIEALGGTLEITARFDKTTVVISNIGETPELPCRISIKPRYLERR